jgi:predicted secreted hydrolase
VRWKIAVPKFGLELDLKTTLKSQELTSGRGTLTPSYWEGAVTYEGTRAGAKIAGVGYLEMTGYDRPFDMGAN